jgi:PAS domain S-box-containing protein/putative nucleotidyltransferase with HDIG domain
MIVEGSRVQAELLRRALIAAGYRVIIAVDGAAGLALARAQHPDAVVSDVTMPLLDGYGMCRAMRADAMLRSVPVILLTMLTDAEDVIRGLNSGADAYLTKPCDMPSLLAWLALLLAHPSLPPPAVERRKVMLQLDGVTHLVDGNGSRMLSMLISTYKNAVLQNRKLAATEQTLEDMNLLLEHRVQQKVTELAQHEQRFRALIENGSDLVLVLDRDGLISYVSPSVLRIGGYEASDLLGKRYTDFMHPDDAQVATARCAALLKEPDSLRMTEFRVRKKDGSSMVLESMASNSLADPAINGIVVNARDVSLRKAAADELIRLNWALRALGLSNAAMVHIGTENEFFQACCDAIASAGGYPLAWIGCAIDDPAHTFAVAVAAQAGDAVGYLQNLTLSWADAPHGNGPTGMAIRSGQIQVNNNLDANDNDGNHAPWREGARVHGFASALALPIITNGTIAAALMVYSRVVDAFQQPEIALFEELAADIGYGIRSRRMRAERDLLLQQQLRDAGLLQESLISTIGAMALMVEKRDPYTAGHQQRVARLCVAIARELGWEESRIEGLRLGATIHDIGKIHVPAEILTRPGKLSVAEFEIIKTHAQIGYDIVEDVKFPWPIKDMLWQHHERLDGSGYPQGLSGDAILLEARIIAVADVVEAMSSHRPYREGLGLDAALVQVRQDAGVRLDVQVVAACERVFGERGFSFDIAGDRPDGHSLQSVIKKN